MGPSAYFLSGNPVRTGNSGDGPAGRRAADRGRNNPGGADPVSPRWRKNHVLKGSDPLHQRTGSAGQRCGSAPGAGGTAAGRKHAGAWPLHRRAVRLSQGRGNEPDAAGDESSGAGGGRADGGGRAGGGTAGGLFRGGTAGNGSCRELGAGDEEARLPCAAGIRRI